MNRISLAQIEQYAFEKKEFILAEDALHQVSQSFAF